MDVLPLYIVLMACFPPVLWMMLRRRNLTLALSVALYFAAQGSGNVLGPVLASTLRLLLVALGGAWVAQTGAGVDALFALVGASMAAYGLATSAAIFFTPWEAERKPQAAPG